ncbi:MAG: hypothetical protein M3169_07725 [Candidatus Eremiobacteraeota bacterium]|nr:hypothetical protein [Candidatus Eremiobacteraeota bacterium]
MSRASRREKAEGELEHLEGRFRERLVAALHACRDGRGGLFGQSDPAAQRALDRAAASRTVPADVAVLLALGDEIDALRSSLGFTDGNALYGRLKSYRRLRTESAPGEPRLAQQFLDELKAADARVDGAS